jgi:hypothetical protein
MSVFFQILMSTFLCMWQLDLEHGEAQGGYPWYCRYNDIIYFVEHILYLLVVYPLFV